MIQLQSARWRHDHRRGLRRATTAIAASVLALGVGTSAAAANGIFDHNKVGQDTGKGVLLPTNQRITPLGQRLLINNGRVIASSISPNGRYLAASSWNTFTGFLTIIDLQANKIVQQIGTGAGTDSVIGDGTVAADAPLWSHDGASVWLPQSADLARFAVATDGTVSAAPVITALSTTIKNLTTGNTVVPDLPSGMALSADGASLYVALNGVNKLATISTSTNAVTKQISVGNAPRQVVLVGNTAYVSDEGGRPAQPGDVTNNSYGTAIVSDPSTGAASTGTVSVVNLVAGKETTEIAVGLQPTAEYLTPDGALLVANSNADSFSVIDTTTQTVAQTVNVNPLPGSTVGSYPNAFTMPTSDTIMVSIGRDNAIAEFGYAGMHSPAHYLGLLPTDFYPVQVDYDHALGKVIVTNDKGIGARGPQSTIVVNGGLTAPAPASVVGHNTYDDTASITSFAVPSMSTLGAQTHQVFIDNDWEKLLSQPAAHPSVTPVAIPRHLGEPSQIKHVFLIVKENRTYDQVLGDIGKGNSDPALAQFGKTVTPNHHSLANSFGLFDNFYDEGTLSADGHNWLMQADANDYIEREFGAFYRSYPAQGGDALAYQRDGFLWNAAAAAGQTSRAYGEYNNFTNEPAPAPSWSDFYQDSQILEGKAKGTLPVPLSAVNTYSDIPSLNAIDDREYPAFDLNIPDQYREDVWNRSFNQYVKSGKLPNLNLVWMPDDHTSGVGSGAPNPVAQVADNDLAVGRMIDTISHSKYWASTAVFVVEDDTQAGADHVDGHRGPLLIASPYAKRGVINGSYFTQLNVVKTIEQILGIAPMNQEDRAAEPMFSAFTDTANTAPYDVVPNQVPLTYGLTPAPAATAATAAQSAGASSAARGYRPMTAAELGIPASLHSTYDAWVVWSRHSRFTGNRAMVDWANPAQLNRLTWYSTHDWKLAYPGDAKILLPSQVPGRNLPNGYLGD